MEALEQKQNVIREVEPIKEFLGEVYASLSALPRSKVAARQLDLIIKKLDQWQTTYEPMMVVEDDRKQEVDSVLRAYKQHGYFALSKRQKETIRWFDEHNSKIG